MSTFPIIALVNADGAQDGPGVLTERFLRAVAMAAQLHHGQIRKGTDDRPVPYLAHLLEVCAIVLGESIPEDVAIAALLHDGPEDAGGRPILDAIIEAFGARVGEIVDACTDTYESPKPRWMERKRGYLDRLQRSDDWDVLVVKCADALSNARATLRDYRNPFIGEAVWQRFKGMPCASGQRWWYASLREALRPLGFSAGAFAELDRTVSALLAETSPCESTEHVHPPMPAALPPPDPDDDEDWMVYPFDPAHRCPNCGRVPIAPPDGFGRVCQHCGHSWYIEGWMNDSEQS